MYRGRLFAVVAAELAAVAALHRLGARVDCRWDGSPEQAMEGLATAGVLAIGSWVALSAIAYTVAAGLGRRRWLDAIGVITVAPVRRLVGRALAVTMAVSGLAAPAAADELPLPPALAHLQPADAGDSHVVRSGDNLWDIARARLAAAGPDPSPADVAAYWIEVIAANQDALQSGDPDLIYPGEIVVLPPLTG